MLAAWPYFALRIFSQNRSNLFAFCTSILTNTDTMQIMKIGNPNLVPKIYFYNKEMMLVKQAHFTLHNLFGFQNEDLQGN